MFDDLYRNLLESGSWNLSEIDDSDYYFLLHLFNNQSAPNGEEKQDPLDFFKSVLSPSDIAKLEKAV